MTTLHLRKSINRSLLRLGLPRKQPRKLSGPRTQAMWIIRGFLLIPLVFACFALLPAPNAFGVNPPPDGGYQNENTAEGTFALLSLTTGPSNTAIGFSALFTDTTGRDNTAVGDSALGHNTIGNFNTAIGVAALLNNTTASNNTATGFDALSSNTTGDDNTATGFQALDSNTTGSLNTANGVNALFHNTTGGNNTANGVAALFFNTTGSNNTANGVDALAGNASGGDNTANGFNALFSNTTGSFNTANGVQALQSNTTGSDNTANGVVALFSNTTGRNNTANGVDALFSNTTGNGNIALGLSAGINLTTGSNNIDIGNRGVAAESATMRIGRAGIQTRTFIAGVRGVAVAGSTVVVNASGQFGIAASSERFKDEIKPMNKASEAILGLQPVTFRYKKNIDSDRIPQFGLVAEDVEKVDPALVVRDKDGKPYSVRYDQVNAMLLNEFLKEHRKIEKQQATISGLKSTLAQERKDFEVTATQQQKEIQALTASFKGQALQIQKVSAQLAAASPSRSGLELKKFARHTAGRIRRGGPAPQVVRLKENGHDESFNGAELSESLLARDWNSPE